MSNSLSDIIFMLLFFFMTATTIKDEELKIIVRKPQATELEKLEKKELVVHVNIGVPTRSYQRLYGTEPHIQVNDAFVDPKDIPSLISSHREAMNESDQAKMIVNIKADRECPMGIITDLKQSLRKIAALKINYAANNK